MKNKKVECEHNQNKHNKSDPKTNADYHNEID